MAVRLISAAAAAAISLFWTSLICAIAAAPPKLRPTTPHIPNFIPPNPPFRWGPPRWNIPPPDGDYDESPPFMIPPQPFMPPRWNIPPPDDEEGPPSPGGGGGGGCRCSCSYSSGPPPPSPPPKVIKVGGDKKWNYGVNYTDWLNQVGDVYVGDLIEFDYAAPARNIMSHSVVLFENSESYKACDLRGSVKLADVRAGSGQTGFRFYLGLKEIGKDQNYYFACGEGNGDHCTKGNMKFAIKPKQRFNNDNYGN